MRITEAWYFSEVPIWKDFIAFMNSQRSCKKGTGTHGRATALYTVLPLAIGSSLVQVFLSGGKYFMYPLL